MQTPHRYDVLISEVGPRDGLQSVNRTMATADKLAWIDALVAAGLQEIEVGSFVSPKLLPQMVDTVEVVRHAIRHKDVTVMALEWETPDAFESTRGISTDSISDGVFASTIQSAVLDGVGDDLDDAAIERSIAEIIEAIRRSAARKQ